MKTDFKAIMRFTLDVQGQRRFSFLIRQKEFFPLLFPKRCTRSSKPGVPGSGSSSCLGSLAEVGITGSSPVTSTEGPPALCSLMAFSSACSWVRLRDLKKATKLGSRGERERREDEGRSSLTSSRPETRILPIGARTKPLLSPGLRPLGSGGPQ